MKPDPTHVLEQLALHLVSDVLPNVQPRYRQVGVGILAALAQAAREEFDRAAARRVEENAVLRALFARAVPVVTEAALGARLAEAAATRDESLRVPALDASNRALRELAIALHAHVETLATPAARALEEALWAELAASTERRRLSSSAF